MKIAVLTAEGRTVAPDFGAARAVIVFDTTGNDFRRQEIRPLSEERGDGTEPRGEALYRALADCELAIAGTVIPAEEKRLRSLGILALPVLPGEAAEVAVRFVLNGEPPKEGEACGSCPNRAERERLNGHGGPLPADALVALEPELPAGSPRDPSVRK